MSVFADKLLEQVKLTLRQSGKKEFDDEIKSYIDTCTSDLENAGILSFYFDASRLDWEVDPQILQAVRWYCLSVFGLYNADMEKYAKAYGSLKATLATQDKYCRDYTQEAEDDLVKKVIERIQDTLKELQPREDKELHTDSKKIVGAINELNNKVGQGGAKEIVIADVLSFVELEELKEDEKEQKVQEFLELSRRASLGEILIMGKLTINSGANYGIIQGIHYDDSGERAVANWSLVSSVWYGIAEDMSLQNVEIEVYGLECDGETITLGMGSPSMGDIATAKEQLTNPSETWTPDEQVVACETIGAVPRLTDKSGFNRVFTQLATGEYSSLYTYYANYFAENASPTTRNSGVPVYVNGELGCAIPTEPYRTANKKYVDDGFVPKTTTAGNRVYVSQSQSDGTSVDSTVPYATGEQSATLALRGSGGTLAVGTPTASAHAVNKNYVDKLPDNLTLTDDEKTKWCDMVGALKKLSNITGELIITQKPDGSTDTLGFSYDANSFQIARRNGNGNIKVGNAVNGEDAVNKNYVDNLPDKLELTSEQKAKWKAWLQAILE